MAKQEDFVQEELLKIGNRIKSIRKEKGYSNYEHFAYETGINRVQYGRYERGEDLRMSSLIRVLDGFGMTLKEFFSEGFD